MQRVGRMFFLVLLFIITSGSVSSAMDANINFNEIFEKHGSIMLIIDVDTGAIVYSNEASQRFYGYSKEILESMSIQDINALTVEEVELERKKASLEERNYFVFNHRLSNGSIRNVEVYSYPYIQNGNQYLFSIINDITNKVLLTEREETTRRYFLISVIISFSILILLILKLVHTARRFKEEEYRAIKNEKQIQSILNNLSGVVYRCKDDPEWTMEYLSKGCYDLTGYYPEDLIGNLRISFSSIVKSEYRSNLISQKNPTYEHEYEIITSQGETKWILDRGKTIFSETGDPIILEGILTDVTGIKLLEQESRELKDRLELVTENISEVVWLFSVDNSKLVFINTAFENMWDIPRELLYKNPYILLETIHADDRKDVINKYKKQLEVGSFEMSFRIVLSCGKVKWLDVKSKVVRNEAGEVIGFVGSASDITSLKEYQISLAESEKTLRESQRVGGLGSYSIDLITEEYKLSEILNEILGLEQKGLHLNEFRERIIHPDDKELFISTYKNSINIKSKFSLVYRIIRANDGDLRWVRDVAESDYDDKDNPSKLVGTIMDITDQKLLEQKILESQQQYLSVVDTQQEMVCRYLSDTTLTFANNAYCRAFDTNTSELLGKKYLKFIPSEFHDKELTAIASLSVDKPVDTRIFKITHPDGSTRWQEWTDTAIFNDFNELIEIQGVGRDITERVLAEENMIKAYDATIRGWAQALDLKDKETENHSQRVTELTVHLAKKLGLEDNDIINVQRGALLHDIGKMGIPDEILLKPGKLSDDEWAIMTEHPRYAYEMLSSIDYLVPALDIPYCHHEKWDGSGYPQGLKGEEIPITARIFAIVDVYDALTNERPYRKAWTKDEAISYIKEQSGIHFDPMIVDLFMKEIDSWLSM